MKISILIPIHNASDSLAVLYNRLKKSLPKISSNYEIILVNDASEDNSWELIKDLAHNDTSIKGINLSRNFGQHHAITAGFNYSDGDWVVVMDCDLQDQPEEIIKLYSKAQEGYDVVFGRRVDRKDSIYKKLGSKIFHIIFNYLTDSKTDETISNFSIVSKKVANAFRGLKEQNRSFYLFIKWLGFKKGYVDVEHAKRFTGKSSYTLKKLTNLATDSIIAHSNKPLKLAIKFGFIMAVSALFFVFWLLFRFFVYAVPVEGWASIMVSIYFIGGLMFANLGFLGLYIGKIFDETKKRPHYIISETTFNED